MRTLFLISLTLFVIPICAESQGYKKGKVYLDAEFIYGIGPGYLLGGEASRFERVGIGWDVYVSYFKKSGNITATDHWTWKYGLLGFMASGVFHFFQGKSIDPFLKAGLGYFIWDNEFGGVPYGVTFTPPSAEYTTGFVVKGEAGLRLFLSKKFALKFSAGYPYYFLHAGVAYEFFDAGDY